ncbi:Sensor protein PfeS [compost metagenome]
MTGEREQDIDALRARLEREVQGMERLIGSTLELVWLDTERPTLVLETVDIRRLWEMVREDACFESGWPAERLRCDLPADCRVHGNLNGLAQALENIVRNAIRYSPEDGIVQLAGRRDAAHWHLWVEDEGPGVDKSKLEHIFQPFTRLHASRPCNEGYGLGLSIARSMIALQGGEVWAENGAQGLRLNLRLASV